MVSVVLDFVIPALAGLALLATLFFFGRAFVTRAKGTQEAYGVGQLDALRSMKMDMMRGIAAAVLGLILLLVFALIPRPDKEEETAVPTPNTPPTAAPATIPPTIVPATPLPTTVSQPVTFTPSAPTAVPPTLTSAAPATATAVVPTDGTTAAPTETPPQGNTATVSSGVGVWLRAAPSTTGEQLEWLLDGVVLTLLDGQETADGFEWQQVRTDAGVEGWVAADYLEINN